MAARLSVREIQPLLDPFNSTIHTIKPIGEIGVLAFEHAQAALHFTHVVAQAINRASDVTQVLQHYIVGVGQGHFHSILVIS
jgi:hypothetical protein